MSLNSIPETNAKGNILGRLTRSKSKASTTKLAKQVSIFSTQQLIVAYVFVSAWMIAFIEFALWYYFNTFTDNKFLYVVTSITIFWLPILAIYFFFFSLRQQDYAASDAKIADGKLAMITTKIPSEPLEIVQTTLKAMLNQDFPRKYDVWLCDEDPQKPTIDWCRENGVKISTRKGNPDYYRTVHPRKRRCKEGNLAYFYDHYGYNDYDFVIQFDADHAPEKDFAVEVMKHFSDPEIGYVATPSIIDANLDESWTVLARNNWESTTHGPLQSGSQDGFAPMCFGSHYSLRTKALKEIGGIGPDIAEDFMTTIFMNYYGWKGSFARNAIAHGMGAVGVVDSMVQEAQWSLVGMRATLLHAHKMFWKMPVRIKFQMLVWMLWYPAVSIVALLSIILPPVYMWTNQSPVSVDGNLFWVKYIGLNVAFIGYVIWLKNLKQLRPTWSWQVSWETLVFQMLQLPWILIGWLKGLWQVIIGFDPIKSEKKKIHITEKVSSAAKPIWFKYFLPHFLIIGLNIPGILYFDNQTPYFWFSFATAFSYSLATSIGIFLSVKEANIFDKSKNATFAYIKRFFLTIASSATLFILTLLSIVKLFI